MKKIQNENEVVNSEEQGEMQTFFFSKEGVTIKAHSMSEARRLLELSKGETEKTE